MGYRQQTYSLWSSCCIFMLLVSVGVPSSYAFANGLFQSTEFRSRVPPPPVNLGLHVHHTHSVFASCEQHSLSCPPEVSTFWSDQWKALQLLARFEQVKVINQLVNRFPYHSDWENFGVQDHWASPLEFLQYSGDCEDYALFKFFLLRHLGVPNDQLRIVLLWNRSGLNAHAVLVFFHSGETLVLDNERDALLRDTQLPHYVPTYSFNETHSWSHLISPSMTDPLSLLK
ncbi:MAG: transglutaminase-like cysteine peptidase [Nitrospirales bacterium]